jgi:hypothetical protein
MSKHIENEQTHGIRLCISTSHGKNGVIRVNQNGRSVEASHMDVYKVV